MSPEQRMCGILDQLRGLRRMGWQVGDGSLPSDVLKAHQETFVFTLPGSLVPSEFRKGLLKRLALASSEEPVSTKKLALYAREYFFTNDKRFDQAVEDVAVEIAGFNQAAPKVANLRARRVRDRYGVEKGWFLASETQITRTGRELTDKEYQLMNLRAAGFFASEVAVKTSLALSTVGKKLSKLYDDLNVKGEIGAALLLVQEGLIDTRLLEDRLKDKGVGLNKFQSLKQEQKGLLEALTRGQAETNEQLACYLGISLPTVGHLVNEINIALGTVGVMNKVGLAVSYWLYQKGELPEEVVLQPAVPRPLSPYQLQLVSLVAAGLKHEEIAEKLNSGYTTIESRLAEVYQALGVKTELDAVLSLIKTRKLNPLRLVGDFELSRLDNLPRRQRKLLGALAAGVDKSDGNKALASYLDCSPSVVHEMMVAISAALGLKDIRKSRMRMTVLFLAWWYCQPGSNYTRGLGKILAEPV